MFGASKKYFDRSIRLGITILRNSTLNLFCIFLIFINLKNLVPLRTYSKKILLVKYGNLGDYFILINQIKKFNQTELKSRVELAVVQKYVKFLNRHLPDLVIHPAPSLRECSGSGFLQKYKQLNKQNYETVLFLGGSSSPVQEDFLAVCVKAKRKLRTFPDLSMGNNFTRGIGGSIYDLQFRSNSVHEGEVIFEQIQHLLGDVSLTEIGKKGNAQPKSENAISIFPGASKLQRSWQKATLERVVSMALEFAGMSPIIVCGTLKEGEIYNELQSLFDENKVFFYFDDMRLDVLEGYVKNSRLVITNDSAALHIAALFNVKTIVFSGQGHLQRFIGEQNFKLTEFPCSNCNWRCTFAKEDRRFHCVSNLSNKESLNELRELFETTS